MVSDEPHRGQRRGTPAGNRAFRIARTSQASRASSSASTSSGSSSPAAYRGLSRGRPCDVPSPPCVRFRSPVPPILTPPVVSGLLRRAREPPPRLAVGPASPSSWPGISQLCSVDRNRGGRPRLHHAQIGPCRDQDGGEDRTAPPTPPPDRAEGFRRRMSEPPLGVLHPLTLGVGPASRQNRVRIPTASKSRSFRSTCLLNL